MANWPGFVPASAMPLIVSGPVPVLFTFTVCAGLALPTATDPKGTAVGDRLSAGTAMLPVRETEPAVAGVATLTVSLAVFGFGVVLVGMKVTSTRQVPLTGSVRGKGPQLLVCANCPGLVPPSATPLMVSGAVPVLATITLCAAVRTFSVELKVNAAVLSESTGAMPVPLTAAVCGLPGPV